MMSAYLHLDSWAGHTKHEVELVRRTPKRFRVKLLVDCLKGKRGTVLNVPKSAVTFEDDRDKAVNEPGQTS